MELIPDEELILTPETDILKTNVYVDTLQEIIKSTDPKKPFTIGLFGGWGSGKSSIVRTLQIRMQEDEDTKTMFYDAWKYSRDAFRRSFLLELREQFELDPQITFEQFYQDKTEEREHKLGIKKFPWVFSIAIIAFAIFLIIYNLFFVTIGWDQRITNILSSIALGLLAFLLRELFVVYKITFTHQKVFSPEQFGEIFKEAVTRVCNPQVGSSKWFKQKVGLASPPKELS